MYILHLHRFVIKFLIYISELFLKINSDSSFPPPRNQATLFLILALNCYILRDTIFFFELLYKVRHCFYSNC